MNQKKCPKCGEMNPAEAVMCWACYTPLAGAAVGPGGAGGAGVGAAAMGATAVATHDDDREKKAIPMWQMGAVGLGLLVLVGFGIKTMTGGTEPGLPEDNGVTTYPTQGGSNNYGPPGPAPIAPGMIAPAPGVGSPGVPEARPARFTMVAAPNPGQDWSTMAIVPTDANVSPQNAASLAKFAKTLMGKGNNRPTQIFVFGDRQAGQQFSEFQVARHSAPLGTQEYTQLADLWPRCLAYYESTGRNERVLYPSRTGANWWTSRG